MESTKNTDDENSFSLDDNEIQMNSTVKDVNKQVILNNN